MTDAPNRRFPSLLPVSVLGNLFLIGLLAGVSLNSPPPRPPGPGCLRCWPGARPTPDEPGPVPHFPTHISCACLPTWQGVRAAQTAGPIRALWEGQGGLLVCVRNAAFGLMQILPYSS